MVIGSLIIFATTSVQLRTPLEGGNEENAVIQLFNRMSFLNKYCFFEINYIMKSVLYPGLFHMALHISRMIDVAPEVELKGRLLNTQRELTKSLLALEVVCKSRASDENWEGDEEKPKEAIKEEVKLSDETMIADKKWAELKEYAMKEDYEHAPFTDEEEELLKKLIAAQKA